MWSDNMTPLACRAPTLIVASAADRLLPSLEESGRLVGRIPDARRVILPNSGHTALLESGISLAEIMGRTGFLPQVSPLGFHCVWSQAMSADCALFGLRPCLRVVCQT